MLPYAHVQPGAAAATGLARHLERDALEGDRVVLGHSSHHLIAEDLVQVHRAQLDEGGLRIAWRVSEGLVVDRQVPRPQISIRGLDGVDAGRLQFVDDAALESPIKPLAPPPCLR